MSALTTSRSSTVALGGPASHILISRRNLLGTPPPLPVLSLRHPCVHYSQLVEGFDAGDMLYARIQYFLRKKLFRSPRSVSIAPPSDSGRVWLGTILHAAAYVSRNCVEFSAELWGCIIPGGLRTGPPARQTLYNGAILAELILKHNILQPIPPLPHGSYGQPQ